MEKFKLVLPSLAIVFAFGATLAIPASNYDLDTAKGYNWDMECVEDVLDGGRTRGSFTGQCHTQDDGNGVCTVTLPGESSTTAYHPSRFCSSIYILYIQD